MGSIFSIAFWGDLNRSVFTAIFNFSHHSPFFDALGVFLAYYLPFLLGAGAIFFMFEQRGVRRRLFFFFEAILAILLSRGIITEILHYAYSHPRPGDILGIAPLLAESGNSFPSGHAALLFALATAIFFYSRGWGISYYLLAVLNGIARIFAGVHWPLDILGGAAIGIASGIFVHALLKTSFNELYRKSESHL